MLAINLCGKRLKEFNPQGEVEQLDVAVAKKTPEMGR